MEQLLLTAAQLGEILNKSPRAVYKAYKRGTIPAPITIGRSLRWRTSDITNFISNSPVQPTVQPTTLTKGDPQ